MYKMVFEAKYSNGDRTSVIENIKKLRSNGKFTVIDVGGSMHGWSHEVVDAICDVLSSSPNILVFKLNINLPNEWKEVDQYIQEHGKFDFSICSHTLEDISNPKFVCSKLTEISKAGYIAVPSKYRELAKFEDWQFPYRGYIHHRWIFTIEDNQFVGYPKISYLEYNPIFDTIASTDNNKKDLSFYWKDSIDVSIINNDYLGPSCSAVKEYYLNLLNHNSITQTPFEAQCASLPAPAPTT
jgi:hypothetical protein